MRAAAVCSAIAWLVALGGCGSDDGTGGTGGTGGTVAGMTPVAGMAGGGAGGMGGMGGTMAGPTYAPTFSAIFQEIIIDQGCNGGPFCHGGAQGMLMMNEPGPTYMALVNQPSQGVNITGMGTHCKDVMETRVIPGDPANSLIMKKITHMPPCGDPMPPSFMLDQKYIDQVRTWIMMGAQNN